MRRLNRRQWVRMWLIIAASILLMAGCSGSGGSGGGGGSASSGTTPSSMALTTDSASISAASTATVTAKVTDESSNPVSGVTVSFSVDSADTAYGTVTESDTTSSTGVATATFRPSGQSGTATVNASTVNDVSDSVEIAVTPVPDTLSLSTDKTSISTNGSDEAVVTANVMDENSVPIPGVGVNFSTSGGTINASGVQTDTNGDASIILSSGADKVNQLVTITATIQDLTATIPIQLSGSTVTLSTNDGTELSEDGSDNTVLEITVKDGGGALVNGADVTITQSGSGSVNLSSTTGTTVNGSMSVTVTGSAAGNVTLTVSAVGTTATQAITVSGIPFAILTPSSSSVAMSTDSTLAIEVQNPTGNRVDFATTMGFWQNNSSLTYTPASTDPSVSATFLSGNFGGTASITVADSEDTDTRDSLAVGISAPAAEAAKVNLQAAPTTLAPSGSGVTNTATLEAEVRNAVDDVVRNAAVSFSLFRTTGGGETISPPIVYTNVSGIAQSTFTSGTLQSDPKGVFCLAQINGAVVSGPGRGFAFVDSNPDTITRSDGGDFTADGFAAGDEIKVFGSASNDGTYTIDGVAAGTITLVAGDDLIDEIEGETLIVSSAETTDVVTINISQSAASIAIGVGTEAESYNSSTYRLPCSVQVVTSSGNYADATVTLSTWPVEYATGAT